MKVSRFTLWFTRVLLAATGALFAMLAVSGLYSPAQNLAPRGVELTSALGITTARIGFGALPMVGSVVLLASLISSGRHLAGLYFLLIFDGIITLVRVVAAFVDGPVPESVRLLAPEIIILIASVTAVLLQRKDRARTNGGSKAVPGQV